MLSDKTSGENLGEVALSRLNKGEKGKIVSVRCNEAGRLYSLGAETGVMITVESNSPLGAVVFSFGATRIAVGRKVADNITVEKVKNGKNFI